MRVVESFTCAKSDLSPSEDTWAVTDDFVGVFDGATDKSERLWSGRTGGAMVAGVLREVLPLLPSDASASEAVGLLTREIDLVVGEVSVQERPSAAGIIYSRSRRELWRVGDALAAWSSPEALQSWQPVKEIDVASSTVRSAYLHALTALGENITGDPGRELILPLLRIQGVLANADPALPFSYGVLNGVPVPEQFVEVLPLPLEATEVVLCSDGYLEPCRTLSEAEAALDASLRADPWRIGHHPGTKGVLPGAYSFDDRTYVRVALGN